MLKNTISSPAVAYTHYKKSIYKASKKQNISQQSLQTVSLYCNKTNIIMTLVSATIISASKEELQ